MPNKIAAIIDAFDEEGREPANYVVEREDGAFEARVWDLNLEKELSLGTCETLGDATHMVWAWSDQVRWDAHDAQYETHRAGDTSASCSPCPSSRRPCRAN
jgi:hypothetical protein